MTVDDPDKPCAHRYTEAIVNVVHLTAGDDGPVEGYSAEIRIACTACGDRFRWIGPPIGFSPQQPMTDFDGFVLRAPVRPESSPEDFGLSIPGVGVRVDGE